MCQASQSPGRKASCFSFPEHFLNYGRFKSIIPNTALTISLPLVLSQRASRCWNFIVAIFLFIESIILETRSVPVQHTGHSHPHTCNSQWIALVYCSLRWDFKTCCIFPRSCSHSLPHPLLFTVILWGMLKLKSICLPKSFPFHHLRFQSGSREAAGARRCWHSLLFANGPCLIGTGWKESASHQICEVGLWEGYYSVYWLGIFRVQLFFVVVNLD